MLSGLQRFRLAQAVRAARDSERTTKCPTALSVAQWALESAWGARQPGNNCFGIKAYPGCYGVQAVDTWEVVNGVRVNKSLDFATFESLTTCFQKHAELITKAPAYRLAFWKYASFGDFEQLVHSVSAVYATDPEYANKLLTILAMPYVQEALRLSDGKKGGGPGPSTQEAPRPV